MVYFITNRTDHDTFIYRSAKIKVVGGYSEFTTFIETTKFFGYDSEGTGARIYKSEILLMQFGDKNDQYVFDCTKGQYREHIAYLNSKITPEHIFFGHNLKYDRNLAYPYGFVINNIYDTMLAEQRLLTGSGLPVNLVAVYERRLKRMMGSDKETRKDFIYMTNNTAVFFIKHIMYAAGDIDGLVDIAIEQRKELTKTGQYNYVRSVEHYLCRVLSDIELTGVPHSTTKWKSILDKKKLDRYKIEKDLDKELFILAEKSGIPTTKFKNRNKGVTTQASLFSDIAPLEIENKNAKNINYNAGKTIMTWITKMGLRVPQFKQGYGEEEKDSLREEAIQTYLLENPSTPLRTFFTVLLKYKELQKFISSYGPKFLYEIVPMPNGKSVIGFRNKFTQRVHTLYKQCFTDTSRLSSGSKDDGYFNSQQLPKEKEVREAFCLTDAEIAAGEEITTADLSSAEAIIMAALANEYKLYELAVIQDDVHSPICTKCWRAVHAYRYANILQHCPAGSTNEQIDKYYTIYDSYKKPYRLTKDFLVDKKTNKDLRTDFKSFTFNF
jgi:DNA polymerase I-like protein with 3'-5' exonuclease and polymerase domains